MNYADAFKIGSKCDGYIRCTYAQLANYDLGVLFSLQAGYWYDSFHMNDARIAVNKQFGFTEKQIINSSDKTTELAQRNADVWGYFTMDLPIVNATEHIEIQKENDFVPVKLTKEAKDLIIALLYPAHYGEGLLSEWDHDNLYYGAGKTQYPKKTVKYLVYKVWIVDRYEGGHKNAYGDMYGGKQHHVGDRELAMETYNPEELKSWEECSKKNSTEYYSTHGGHGKGSTVVHHWTEEAQKRGWYAEIEEQMVKNPQIEELISAIQEDRTFYVKACAIDWIPTNADVYVQDPNGKMGKLADRLEAARKRLETAKAILATAATLTII